MISLDIWDASDGSVKTLTLDLRDEASSAAFFLRGVDGARAIELLVRDDGRSVLLAEIACDAGTLVEGRVFRRGAGEWHVTATPGPLLRLPPESHRREPLLARRAAESTIDLVFLIDGTAREYVAAAKAKALTKESGRGGARDRDALEPIERLLPHSEPWRAITRECVALAERLAEQVDGRLRWMTLAFGDYRPPSVSAHDLRPAYVVQPDGPRRVFRGGLDSLAKDGFEVLRPSAGGDFVDALADGLHTATELPWSPAARKILVLIGDSPGYSVLNPPPSLSNAQSRIHDVDTEAAALHARGVEIVTVRHDIGLTRQDFLHLAPEIYLHYTEEQYRAVASLPAYATQSSTFRGVETARAILDAPRVIARGAFPGIPIEN
jgi:hypothetical protein